MKHLPRFMIHRTRASSWPRVGVWHSKPNGSPVLKTESSLRTVSAVYMRLWNGDLLVFQWRGFYRSRHWPYKEDIPTLVFAFLAIIVVILAVVLSLKEKESNTTQTYCEWVSTANTSRCVTL